MTQCQITCASVEPHQDPRTSLSVAGGRSASGGRLSVQDGHLKARRGRPAEVRAEELSEPRCPGLRFRHESLRVTPHRLHDRTGRIDARVCVQIAVNYSICKPSVIEQAK